MSYATLDDLERRYPGELTQAGPQTGGALDEEAVERALSAADARCPPPTIRSTGRCGPCNGRPCRSPRRFRTGSLPWRSTSRCIWRRRPCWRARKSSRIGANAMKPRSPPWRTSPPGGCCPRRRPARAPPLPRRSVRRSGCSPPPLWAASKVTRR